MLVTHPDQCRQILHTCLHCRGLDIILARGVLLSLGFGSTATDKPLLGLSHLTARGIRRVSHVDQSDRALNRGYFEELQKITPLSDYRFYLFFGGA
jgi:hypothetical protein